VSLTPAQYLARKLAGLCVRQGCAHPQRETALTCAEHARYHDRCKTSWYRKSKRNRAKHLACTKRWRERALERGLCCICARRALYTETLCRPCHARRHAADRKRRPVSLARRCRLCRQPGHNWLTCRLRGADRAPLEEFALARRADGG
jgi:hypothetical protein